MSEIRGEFSSKEVFMIPEALPQAEPFKASLYESICAALIFIPAYLYVLYAAKSYQSPDYVWCIAGVAAGLIGITELLHRGVRRSAESWVWLFCFVSVCFSFVRAGLADSYEYEMQHVWYSRELFLFVHIFAVWWILSRSGKLAEGKSGHLLPLDALNGFIIFPFSNFFLKIRSIWYSLRSRKESGKKTDAAVVAAVLVSVGVCVLLFLNAAQLLSDADSAFAELFDKIREVFSFDLDEEVFIRIIFSIPVSSWLFGLIAGSVRTKDSFLENQRGSVNRFLTSIRRVPPIVWTCVIAAFSVMYLVFFWLQGSYLFGAFTRTLPEGFIVSQYARQGFFELCKVMALNFVLLWMVTRMAAVSRLQAAGPGYRSLKISCIVLLAESMVFAVIAFSKLLLYIDCFGFTPLRLQSSWLVCVLFAGCLCWLYNLLTGRPVFRRWMYFGAVSLAVLSLI
ncbi:MAG: DUF4173 domain-containing protein [Firmicutes bacterium]|nr:DUF4173 domain-containing protein [Bacillota bacterium]